MLTKVCKRCGREKPLIKFDKSGAPIVNVGERGGDGRRATCTACRRSQQRRGAPLDAEAPTRFTRALNATRYLITSAQNATPVHPEFFAALQRAAEYLAAELVVIPFRYKNPTSLWTSKQQSDEWWAPELAPYLHNTRKKLNANLVLAADVKIQPTASSPLTGFEALTGAESCIIGHPKMQYRAVASPIGRMAKILSTTGAVTQRNYTDTKAGALGKFHHYLGAIIVEIDGPTFHLRQLNADRKTGEFIDLDLCFAPEVISAAPPAANLTMGDTHARFISKAVDAATFGRGGIVETLKPRKLTWHDLHDGYAINPHHKGDPFIAHAKAAAGIADPKAEVEHAIQFVKNRTPAGCQSVIVASNHDDFLTRWIKNSDWRDTGAREFYLETALAMLKGAKMTEHGTVYPDAFAYWVNRLKGNAPIRALRKGESFKVAGIENSYHGDRGPKGARGTMKNFARVGAKMNTGHGHEPGIEEGHYRGGTSTPLHLEYTVGSPSAWLNAHIVTYANGKRALITMIDGAWRLAPAVRRRAA